MANIPLQSITFPGLSDKYTTPTVDATLTQTGAAADAKKTGDEIGAIKNDFTDLSEKVDSAFVTETATGSIASFPDGADDVPVKDLTVAIEPVQSGSGDPSPSNVRPISGWTGANVTACGKNLVDYSDNVRNQMSYAGGVISNSTTDDRTSAYINIALLKNNTQASRLVQSAVIPVGVLSKTFTVDNEFDHIRIWHSGSRVDFICAIPLSLPNGTYTLSIDFTGVNPSVVGGLAYKDIQVEAGSTVTAYEPFQGETYEVDWTTEAGTVYGGTLDVTTGVLTVDKVKADLGSMTWGKIADGRFSTNGIMSTVYSYASSEQPDMASNWYKTVTYNESWAANYNMFVQSTGYLYVRNDSYTDAATFKAAMAENNVYVVYKLATPVTYQLTPTEVATILGQNNIFADTGNVTVQYRADTKLYIDKVLSA